MSIDLKNKKSNLEKWIQAMLTEDLQMIKHEFERLKIETAELQKENAFLSMEISRLKDEDNS